MSRLKLSAKAVGLEEALSRLKGLPNKVRRDALRPAFRQIGSMLAKDVKSQLPGKRQGTTGQTKLSIGVKLSIKGSKVSLVVGPRSGYGVYFDARAKETQRRDAQGRYLAKLGDASGITKESRDSATRRLQRVTFQRAGVRYHNPTRIFHILEAGSKRMRGRRPLEIALNRNKARIPGIVKQHVDKVLASYGSNNK